MTIERTKKNNTEVHRLASLNENGEQAPELRPDTRQEPASLAEKRIAFAEHDVEMLAREGLQRQEMIEKKYGASVVDLVAARDEIRFFDRWERIHREAGALAQIMKDRILGHSAKERRVVNSPIGENEVFSPEAELRAIQQAPKSERVRLVRSYKEKLAHQKEGLAFMQEQIIRVIRENPDIPSTELYALCDDFGDRYGFTGEQKFSAHELLDAYQEKHARVRAIRNEYSNDEDLYRVLFARPPKGRVEVVEGPMTLYVRCQDTADYAWIHSQSFLEGGDVTSEDVQRANRSGGVSIGTSLIKGLEGAIIAENAQGLKYHLHFDLKSLTPTKGILEHEEQHAIRRLFQSKTQERNLWMRFDSAQSDTERVLALREFLRLRREAIADERAKDEILAFLKGRTAPWDTFKHLVKPEEKGGLYDYLRNETVYLGSKIRDLFDTSGLDVNKLITEVFGKEYRRVLQDGIFSVTALKAAGYGDDAIVALLIQEPLSLWRKNVKRLTDHGKMKTANTNEKENNPNMEKKKLASKPHLELLIPNKKQKKEEAHPGFTEEELLRSEAWHGKKDVVVESSEAKTADRPKRVGTLRSLDEARDRKAKKQQDAPAVDAEPALETREQTVLDSEYIPVEEKVVSAAEIREVREQEEERIGVIAQEIFDKRMQGVDAERIDAMLVEKGIKPWTPEAEEFMRTWDWEQAEKKFKELAREREAAVLAANEAMPEKPVALRAEQMERVSEKFGAFNIDLETLPKELKEEFETLTYGQRLLLAENLQQLTLGRVQEEAKERYQKALPEATFLKSKLLGRIWQSASKKYQIAGHAQATALDIKKGGLAYHGELLQQLVEGAKRTGLDAIEGKDGVLELQYVQEHPLMTERQKEQSKEFNRVATLYSKVPYEWSLATATTDQKKEYERMHAQFEHAKEQVLKVEQGIVGDKDSLLFVADIENKIRLNQFLNTHPDAEKQLQSIESDNALKKVLGDIVTERGIYFGAGLATRTFATGLLGAVGFPLAAVGMGGWMARKRAVETLRERDIAARQGKRDTSNEARNVATAHVLFEKLEGLVARINSEPDEKKRQQHLAALQVRLEYTKNKLDAGLVDFGSVDRRIVNQYGLMDALTQGDSTLLAHDADRLPIDDEKNVYRAFRFWRREEKVSKAQKDYLRKQMIYGAGLGIAAFAAGHYAKDVFEAAGPAEAHAASESTSGIRKYPMPPRMEHHPIPPRPSGDVPVAQEAAPGAARVGASVEKHPIPPRPGAQVAPAQEAMPGASVAKGAATAAREAAPSSEALHTTLDIGKRGPEGAFIDELKKHPEVAQRLGIKDIGKEAHAAWSEFAKQALKDPQTIKSLQDHGFAPNAKGYEEMMRRIASGKIILEEQNGKLHMRIDDATEYLKARAPKHGVSGAALKDNDIPTGPQFLGGEPGPLAAAPAQPTPEDIPTGPQILGSSPDARPNVPLTPGVEHITDQAVASDVDDIPRGPQILGGPASTAEQPFINVEAAVRDQSSEGIIDDVAREHVSSVETFVDHQFGMSGKEYAAIKQVKVGELLQQIPSRDEAWSIWRGDVQGKDISLPHDGIYGASEFKKHVDLAEHIRAMQPDAAAMQTDVDTFIKHEVKSIVRPVAEAPIAPEPRVSPIIETKPLAPDSFTVEDIPAETQSHNVPPSSEVQPHAAAPSTESVQPISAEAPIDGGGVPASSHVEHIPSAAPLTPEKLMLLEDDIYRSKAPVQKILMQYKVGNVAPEDFARYYSSVVAGGAHPSPEMLENIKVTFAEAAGEINPQRRIPSQRALDTMVLRMQEGKR